MVKESSFVVTQEGLPAVVRKLHHHLNARGNKYIKLDTAVIALFTERCTRTVMANTIRLMTQGEKSTLKRVGEYPKLITINQDKFIARRQPEKGDAYCG